MAKYIVYVQMVYDFPVPVEAENEEAARKKVKDGFSGVRPHYKYMLESDLWSVVKQIE